MTTRMTRMTGTRGEKRLGDLARGRGCECYSQILILELRFLNLSKGIPDNWMTGAKGRKKMEGLGDMENATPGFSRRAATRL